MHFTFHRRHNNGYGTKLQRVAKQTVVYEEKEFPRESKIKTPFRPDCDWTMMVLERSSAVNSDPFLLDYQDKMLSVMAIMQISDAIETISNRDWY